jgi:hypothetical protein
VNWVPNAKKARINVMDCKVKQTKMVSESSNKDLRDEKFNSVTNIASCNLGIDNIFTVLRKIMICMYKKGRTRMTCIHLKSPLQVKVRM